MKQLNKKNRVTEILNETLLIIKNGLRPKLKYSQTETFIAN